MEKEIYTDSKPITENSEPLMLDICDPLGIKWERVTFRVDAETGSVLRSFAKKYNRWVRFPTYFLIAWFIAENLVFALLFTGHLTHVVAVPLFCGMVALLGIVYSVFPYVTFDLYSSMGVRNGVGLVRISGVLLIIFSLLLSFILVKK